MKTQLPLTVLLVLFGCGAPAPEQQSQSQVVEPPAVTTAGEFPGKVIKVIDGDTIDVLTDDNETIRIRLYGIDCPERGQPFGNNATQALKFSVINGRPETPYVNKVASTASPGPNPKATQGTCTF